MLHLHWLWDKGGKDALHNVSIAVAACGTGKLPRSAVTHDPSMVTCPACRATASDASKEKRAAR